MGRDRKQDNPQFGICLADAFKAANGPFPEETGLDKS
jgi:hypothetical protein